MAASSRIKILFILPSLRAGGAERVITYISQNLDKLVFDCQLLVIASKIKTPYSTDRISVRFLNKTRALHAIPPIFKILISDKPDIVFTTTGHLNILMGLHAFFFPNIKFIVREANVKSVVKNFRPYGKKKSWVSNSISRLGYRQLNAIICQSNDMAKDLMDNYNFPEIKLTIINNPIPESLKRKKLIEPVENDGYKLITVGRLVQQKGHLRILEALAKVDLPFKYTIIGDGPEKDIIMLRAKELNLYDRITHLPFTKEVFEHLGKNHLFLQGSFVEGFPNALLESCAVGTPVLAFKATGGIDEIVDIGVNGLLAENTEDYANNIVKILESLPKWKPDIVSRSVFEKYNSKKILESYERLFVDTVRKK